MLNRCAAKRTAGRCFWGWILVAFVGFGTLATAGYTRPLHGQDAAPEDSNARYGVGATYKGRPIAPVMSWRGWQWLFRPDRERWERPEELLDALRIPRGATVADIGAGAGYFTVRLARRVGPTGKVYAVDIQPQMIALLKKRVQEEGLKNVIPILSKPEDPMLPEGFVDLALLVDVYHEIADPESFMPRLLRALKPDGRLVLVEYRAEDRTVPIRPEHKMFLRQVKLEMDDFGLRLAELHEFLPWQHVLVFRKRVVEACDGFPAVYVREGEMISDASWESCGFRQIDARKKAVVDAGRTWELDMTVSLDREGDGVLVRATDAENAGGWSLRWAWPNKLTLVPGGDRAPVDLSGTLHWVLYGKRELRLRITLRQDGDRVRLALDSMPLGGEPFVVRPGQRVELRTSGQATPEEIWVLTAKGDNRDEGDALGGPER